MGRLLMASRDDLVTALSARYGASPRSERGRILDEFVAVTGVHRKHLMKLLRAGRSSRGNGPRLGRRLYDAAMREALVVLWEASDRICSKRLRPMIPILLEAMERHGHLGPASEIRAGLLVMSAATIDRSLREVWDLAGGRSRRRTAPSKALRRGIPVRTFADWHDPALGLVEADLVAHSGPTSRGSFLQTLTLIDVATGWTEYAPVLAREQQLLTEVLGEMRKLMPFPLLDFDTDNDSVFMNETVKAYCQDCGITFTRCRPYKKNDQAFVVRKNGAVVRRIVGYRRFEGLDAAAGLARLYRSVRLFVNLCQPSFKLAEKTREGALVRKRYHPPATPAQRLLSDPRTSEAPRLRVEALCRDADPIRLLSEIRTAQHNLVALADRGRGNRIDRIEPGNVPLGVAHGLAGWRGPSDGSAERHAQAVETASRSVRERDGADERLVRGRAVAELTRVLRAVASRAARHLPGRSAPDASAADEGLAARGRYQARHCTPITQHHQSRGAGNRGEPHDASGASWWGKPSSRREHSRIRQYAP